MSAVSSEQKSVRPPWATVMTGTSASIASATGRPKPSPACRVHVAAGDAVQALDLGAGQVLVDPADVGRVGVAAAGGAQDRQHLVVRVRMGLEDEGDVVLGGERGEIRGDDDVDGLAGQRRADVEEDEALVVTHLAGQRGGVQAGWLDPVAGDGDRHADPGCPKHAPHIRRCDADTVYVGVERRDVVGRDERLLPSEAEAPDPARCICKAWRMKLPNRDIGVRGGRRRFVELRSSWVSTQIRRLRCVVAGALRRVDRDFHAVGAIERERKLSVDRGQAVRSLERSLDLNAEWMLVTQRAAVSHARARPRHRKLASCSTRRPADEQCDRAGRRRRRWSSQAPR